eukprot:GHVS01039181.1.p1 GENE.GHVS01039181.1~~GHVS01039181.1.p1  ORF type:complete len:298 (+),score=54.17 GHVS01039181.1:288-1181(+)
MSGIATEDNNLRTLQLGGGTGSIHDRITTVWEDSKIQSEGRNLQMVCKQLQKMVRASREENHSCAGQSSETTIAPKRLKAGGPLADHLTGVVDSEEETGNERDEWGHTNGGGSNSGCLSRMMEDRNWCDQAIDDVMRHAWGARPPCSVRRRHREVVSVNLRPLAEWLGGKDYAEEASRSGKLEESQTVDGGAAPPWGVFPRSVGELLGRTAMIPERLLQGVEALAAVDAQLEELASQWGETRGGTGKPGSLMEEGNRRAEELLGRHQAVLQGLSVWLDKTTEETDLFGAMEELDTRV